MPMLLVTPAVLSLLVLAAHFLRMGNILFVGASLIVAALLFVPRRWSTHVVQFVLVLAAAEWMFTLYALVQDRQAEGREWVRAAVILFCVAALNVIAAGLLRLRTTA